MADQDHALLGGSVYVIESGKGRLISRDDTQIDHVAAFATIKNRVADFLVFINDTLPVLAPSITRLYGDFFMPTNEAYSRLIGTQYLFISL